MMMMNCFCGMVDQRETFSHISCQDMVRDPRHHESLTCCREDLNPPEPEFRLS